MEHTISLALLRHYSFARQHVTPGAQAPEIGQVAQTLVGVHSARLQTPFVALHNRVVDFSVPRLRHELHVARRFIKLRCMRKTLHTVPLALAPVVHQATLGFRVAECDRLYRKLGLSPGQIRRLQDAVMLAVQGRERSSREIEIFVRGRCRLEKDVLTAAVRASIKELWERGRLCYLNQSEHWGQEERYYADTGQHYAGLSLDSIEPEEAQRQLVRFYIDGYGPALEEDLCWWSGLSQGVIRRCIAHLGSDAVRVRVDGLEGSFLMSRRGREAMLDSSLPREPWVRLLAYEDPSLKGYAASRARYVDVRHYSRLFNAIGEARASIVADGEVVGCWTWDKKRQDVVLECFNPLKGELPMLLVIARERLAQCLRGGPVQRVAHPV
ncbi:DNA glycosylase AlkZ-like family protein [Archangium violaceum]|uniref:DNA glycosylase AlkZ-like family protein n=1 Tax=Archangium violaceum TaxID=83451 RepID=UPI00193B868D|nr:crosslink repair DNA glycosylase YcaQ family protein [Archangium violaceum]